MSLALNIYAAKDRAITAEAVQSFLKTQPHFQPAENGEFVYQNEDTGVYFVVGNEPVEHAAKGFHSLDISFTVNYGRPEFFALEIFPVIAAICDKLGLLLDNEQAGKPQKIDVTQLHKAWLQTNDSFMRQLQKQHDPEETGLAYMPRKASNELWRFMLDKEKLQNNMTTNGQDVYVASPLLFRDQNNQVVAAVAWPAAIPIVIPPHTDFALLMTGPQKRLLFASSPKPLGYVTIKRLLEVVGDSFVHHKDGSIELSQAEADKVRSRVLGLPPDFDAKHLLGKPLAPDHIVDVKA